MRMSPAPMPMRLRSVETSRRICAPSAPPSTGRRSCSPSRAASANARRARNGLGNGVLRLLEASRHTVSEVPLGDLPTSLAEALRFDNFEPHTEHVTVSAPNRGGEALVQGQGGGEDEGHADRAGGGP